MAEKTEAQRRKMTCPKSHRRVVAEPLMVQASSVSFNQTLHISSLSHSRVHTRAHIYVHMDTYTHVGDSQWCIRDNLEIQKTVRKMKII